MKSRLPALILLCAAVSIAKAGSLHVLKLPADHNYGASPKTYRFPNGTVLTNTFFYQSKASDLSVGRSYVNGPLMPRATANYTDMFMVADGAATLVEASGKSHRLMPGDFVLLPRGLTFEVRDANHYVHYFASFETQKGAAFDGPIALRLLHPRRLHRNEFVSDHGGRRHTYYEGRGGVRISAYCYPDRVHDRKAARMAYSELMFVVSGSGALREAGQPRISLMPGAAAFIPKGAAIDLEATRLCTLSVQFDRNSATTEASAVPRKNLHSDHSLPLRLGYHQ